MSATTTAESLPTSRAPRGAWAGVLRQSLHYGQMRIGLAITGFIVLLAVLGPLLAPHSPDEFVAPPVSPPSATAWFGTDSVGRDVLSRAMHGGWSVLWMSVGATVLGVVLGVVVGLIAGYSRSWLDETLMRGSDVVLAFPQIVLALLFVSLLGPKLWLIVLIVAVSHVPRVARLVRGVTLDVVQREFVQAAEVLGVSKLKILTRDVLPNLMTPLMVEFGLRLTWSIGIIAGISFLGLGLQPPSSDWGLMINQNRSSLVAQPWAVMLPVLLIALFTIGTNLMTEGVARGVAGIDRKVEP